MCNERRATRITKERESRFVGLDLTKTRHGKAHSIDKHSEQAAAAPNALSAATASANDTKGQRLPASSEKNVLVLPSLFPFLPPLSNRDRVLISCNPD